MRNSRIISMPSVLLVASMVMVLLGSVGPVNGSTDPLIEDDLVLEVRSPIDSDPLMLSLMIPWTDGPPIIDNVSYSIRSGNWSELEGWQRSIHEIQNMTIIDFSMHFDWGETTTLLVKVTDDMGTNSTVGREIICSRPPIVGIISQDQGEDHFPGIHIFSADFSDPDGQELKCLWTVDGEPASSDHILTTHLNEGAHEIKINITDGQWWIEDELEILVIEPKTQTKDVEKGIVWYISLSFLVVTILIMVVFMAYVINERIKNAQMRRMISNGERKVKVGPSSRACDICLGGFEKGMKIHNCRCGARFHMGCGRREGTCPECGREILI